MVQAFQTIVSRNKKPVDAGVISVTMMHAGEATNVVPDFCELQGTVRNVHASPALLDYIQALAEAYGREEAPAARDAIARKALGS